MVHFASHNVVTRSTGMLEQVDIELASVASPSRGLHHDDAVLLAFDEGMTYDSPNYRWFRAIVRAVVRHAFIEGQEDGVDLTDPPRIERPFDEDSQLVCIKPGQLNRVRVVESQHGRLQRVRNGERLAVAHSGDVT